jgi:hypothetical protein
MKWLSLDSNPLIANLGMDQGNPDLNHPDLRHRLVQGKPWLVPEVFANIRMRQRQKPSLLARGKMPGIHVLFRSDQVPERADALKESDRPTPQIQPLALAVWDIPRRQGIARLVILSLGEIIRMTGSQGSPMLRVQSERANATRRSPIGKPIRAKVKDLGSINGRRR